MENIKLEWSDRHSKNHWWISFQYVENIGKGFKKKRKITLNETILISIKGKFDSINLPFTAIDVQLTFRRMRQAYYISCLFFRFPLFRAHFEALFPLLSVIENNSNGNKKRWNMYFKSIFTRIISNFYISVDFEANKYEIKWFVITKRLDALYQLHEFHKFVCVCVSFFLHNA